MGSEDETSLEPSKYKCAVGPEAVAEKSTTLYVLPSEISTYSDTARSPTVFSSILKSSHDAFANYCVPIALRSLDLDTDWGKCGSNA